MMNLITLCKSRVKLRACLRWPLSFVKGAVPGLLGGIVNKQLIYVLEYSLETKRSLRQVRNLYAFLICPVPVFKVYFIVSYSLEGLLNNLSELFDL